ncbi:hypothetical protein BDZ89DRAFT_1068316 [Hymenopellis radicata]|nr:hypothetical protein BDZ89DRAFT_1068316 [Hymenopellis radicata]
MDLSTVALVCIAHDWNASSHFPNPTRFESARRDRSGPLPLLEKQLGVQRDLISSQRLARDEEEEQIGVLSGPITRCQKGEGTSQTKVWT